MMSGLQLRYWKQTFIFKTPSGTSRGILTEKKSWFLEVWDQEQPNVIGLGECSIIEGLSPEFTSEQEFERVLSQLTRNPDMDLRAYPSILFGLETALLDLRNGGKGIYFRNDFALGNKKIPINGLIWMGSRPYMWDQIESKIASGFTTIKLKIGALDTEEELSILREIRERYTPEEIELRVDANGAFSYEKARDVLKILKDLTVHSIEQPIKKGNWSEMALLAKEELTPIALDEELIGVNDSNSKFDLLSKIRPQYIVLKPSLHGGISGCRKWIQIAEELQIGWWMTSALESNVGLDAIAQFTGEYDIRLPQGLGTGGLFVSNIERNLHVEQGYIYKNQF